MKTFHKKMFSTDFPKKMLGKSPKEKLKQSSKDRSIHLKNLKELSENFTEIINKIVRIPQGIAEKSREFPKKIPKKFLKQQSKKV